MAKAHLRTLDAMRGVAAIAVMLYHAKTYLPFAVSRSGYLAVDFFFVLSGFVVAKAYDDRLGRDLTPWAFLQKRLIRFYPLMVLGLAIGVIVIRLNHQVTSTAFVISLISGLLFLPSFATGKSPVAFPFNGPSWSLFFELAINGLFAGFHRYLSNRVLALITLVGAGLMVAAVVILHRANVGADITTLWGGAARVLFSFPAGVLLYRYRGRIPAALGRGPSWIPLVLLFGLLAVAPSREMRSAFELGFIFIASPLLVAWGAQVEPSTRLAPSFYFLGAISFALYAIHSPILQLLGVAVYEFGWRETYVGTGFVCAMPVVAWFADRADEPLRRWLAARLRPAKLPSAITP